MRVFVRSVLANFVLCRVGNDSPLVTITQTRRERLLQHHVQTEVGRYAGTPRAITRGFDLLAQQCQALIVGTMGHKSLLSILGCY